MLCDPFSSALYNTQQAKKGNSIFVLAEIHFTSFTYYISHVEQMYNQWILFLLIEICNFSFFAAVCARKNTSTNLGGRLQQSLFDEDIILSNMRWANEMENLNIKTETMADIIHLRDFVCYLAWTATGSAMNYAISITSLNFNTSHTCILLPKYVLSGDYSFHCNRLTSLSLYLLFSRRLSKL